MKNSFISLIMLISTIFMVKAEQMQDLPALSRTEHFIRGAAKWGAAGAGALTGLNLGGTKGYELGKREAAKIQNVRPSQEAIYDPVTGESKIVSVVYFSDPSDKTRSNIKSRYEWSGAGLGATVGGVAGYTGAGLAGDYLLAKLHGVSYRVEKISQLYDINIKQYGSNLSAAASKSIPAINQSLQAVFSKRFGQNWQSRIVSLFDKYDNRLGKIMRSKRTSLSQDKSDFLRMVEIGAAMANLYFGSTPSKKSMLENATKMYQELGLI